MGLPRLVGAAIRVPAVVGSWPQPFADGYEGKAPPGRGRVPAAGEGPAAMVRRRLEGAGVTARRGLAPTARSGSWSGPGRRLRDDPAAALIEDGPQASGVFAEFDARARRLRAGRPRRSRRPAARPLGAGAGLVAATRRYEEPPTWVVTGGDAGGGARGGRLLDEADLRDHYAVAPKPRRGRPLPAPPGGGR